MKHFNALLSILLAFSMVFAAARLVLAGESIPERTAARYEIDYMTNTVERNLKAVEQAQMCISDARHEELKQFCEDYIAVQNQETILMQFWIYDWFKVNYEPKMSLHNVRYLDLLDGTEFEIEFMETVINHHLSAIEYSKICLERAYHKELFGQCNNKIAAHTEEIQTIQSWLCNWYEICSEQFNYEEVLISARQ